MSVRLEQPPGPLPALGFVPARGYGLWHGVGLRRAAVADLLAWGELLVEGQWPHASLGVTLALHELAPTPLAEPVDAWLVQRLSRALQADARLPALLLARATQVLHAMDPRAQARKPKCHLVSVRGVDTTLLVDADVTWEVA